MRAVERTPIVSVARERVYVRLSFHVLSAFLLNCTRFAVFDPGQLVCRCHPFGTGGLDRTLYSLTLRQQIDW